jgi:hypothetical protein
MSPNTLQPNLTILNHQSIMYSIHVVKDEVPTQLVEEPPTNLMCMLDGISYHG